MDSSGDVDLWRLTVQHSPVAMVLVGLEGRPLMVNQALCDMLGYPAAELRRRGFQELTHPDDLEADLALFEQVLAGEIDSYRLRKRYLHADGSVVWGDLSVALVRDADGAARHFISQILDVSEQRAYEELQDQFVSSVSHELRTPLSSVMGYLELLEENDDLPADATAQLRIVKRNAERLRALLSDLLHLGQAREGNLQLERRSVDLVAVAREAVQAAVLQAVAAGVTVCVAAPDLLLAEVDERRIRQVIDNLLSNAIKYCDPGDTIDVVLRGGDAGAELEVVDTGVGIPSSELGRVFERFFRGQAAIERRTPGTGLGLDIVASIVEALGGAVDLDSEPGRGTCVRVTFPQTQQPQTQRPETQQPES